MTCTPSNITKSFENENVYLNRVYQSIIRIYFNIPQYYLIGICEGYSLFYFLILPEFHIKLVFFISGNILLYLANLYRLTTTIIFKRADISSFGVNSPITANKIHKNIKYYV